MRNTSARLALLGTALFVMTACAGGGGAGGGGGGSSSGGGDVSLPTEPTSQAVEVTGAGFTELSRRGMFEVGDLAYVSINRQSVSVNKNGTIDYKEGVLSGEDLAGRDIDESEFINPANGEFSRVFVISNADSVFGVVGLDADRPATGTVTQYNEGWVGMQAIFEDRTLTLTGDASFTATWDTNQLRGRFFNLSGRNSLDQTVTNIGTIDLSGAAITNEEFSGGTVTGTGAFAGLDGGSNTNGTRGFFFGPEAEELGGVLKIDEIGNDIQVIGAFQAD